MKQLSLSLAFVILFTQLFSQKTTFVHLSDLHVGQSTGAEDLRRSVKDINNNPEIDFIIITGDITEFGSDEQLHLAKQILDSLNKPYHIVPGNHDSNWSESGANSFKSVFGSETVIFKAGDFLFLGTHSGPNMRMSPGQIPRENIVWLDSVLQKTSAQTPIIFMNHFPLDSGLNNWYEAIDLLKTKNIQLALCGHGHKNRTFDFEGIPGIMGRSNLRAAQETGGYNIATIKEGQITYTERNPVTGEEHQWAVVTLKNHSFTLNKQTAGRPSFEVNNQYRQVKTKWQYTDNSDIGSGVTADKKHLFASNTAGEIYALNKKTGKKRWSYQTGGKIYSTPAVSKGRVITASTDGYIYCNRAGNGQLLWKFKTEKPNVANASISKGVAFIGSGDGIFRAIDIHTGKLKWQFDGVKGFVVTKPLIYGDNVYFGSWGTEFYALDLQTGNLAWKWNNGHPNTMFSPAACYPVAARNKIFIAAPDRYMTVFDAATGDVLWRHSDPHNRVRESIGLSKDSSMVYAKTMEGEVIGVSTAAPQREIVWTSNTRLGYEIAPTAIIESAGVVYTPQNSGLIAASKRQNGEVLWKHKISNSLVTNIYPMKANQIVVTTMDGKITFLNYKP